VTRFEALSLLLVGYLGLVVGLTWALGPWALVATSVVLMAAALLVPERERREPADPTPSP
jgi:predicted branched-subunit amino acid permease